MDHQRRPVVVQQIALFAFGQRDHVIGDVDGKAAVRIGSLVAHIAGVRTVGIVKAVLISGGVEMAAGRLEAGADVAVAGLVDMEAMLSGRDALDGSGNGDTVGATGEREGAELLLLGVYERGFGRARLGKTWGGEGDQAAGKGGNRGLHGDPPSVSRK